MCGYWLRSLRSLHLSRFASPNSDRDPIWNSVSISGILLQRHIPITSNFFGASSSVPGCSFVPVPGGWLKSCFFLRRFSIDAVSGKSCNVPFQIPNLVVKTPKFHGSLVRHPLVDRPPDVTKDGLHPPPAWRWGQGWLGTPLRFLSPCGRLGVLGCLGSPPWSRYATYQPNPSGDHGDIVGIECKFHGILDWIEINSAMPLLNGEVARLIYGSPGHSLHFLGGLQSLEK